MTDGFLGLPFHYRPFHAVAAWTSELPTPCSNRGTAKFKWSHLAFETSQTRAVMVASASRSSVPNRIRM